MVLTRGRLAAHAPTNERVRRVDARRLVSGRACEMAVAVLAAAHGTPTSPGA
jgi:hypothetical protein